MDILVGNGRLQTHHEVFLFPAINRVHSFICCVRLEWSYDEGVTEEFDGILCLVKVLFEMRRNYLVIAEQFFGNDRLL